VSDLPPVLASGALDLAVPLCRRLSLITGLVILLFVSGWGLGLIAAAPVIRLVEKAQLRRHQVSLHEKLRKVPLYAELLKEYPEARIVVARDAHN